MTKYINHSMNISLNIISIQQIKKYFLFIILTGIYYL